MKKVVLFAGALSCLTGCGIVAFLGDYGKKPDNVIVSTVNIEVSFGEGEMMESILNDLSLKEYCVNTLTAFAANSGRFNVVDGDAPYTLSLRIESITLETYDAVTLVGAVNQINTMLNQADDREKSGKDYGIESSATLFLVDNNAGDEELYGADATGIKVVGSSHVISGLTVGGEEVSRDWHRQYSDEFIIEAVQAGIDWGVRKLIRQYYDENFIQ